MRDCYIPDLTERYPEGFDGVDMYERYNPEYEMWKALEMETKCERYEVVETCPYCGNENVYQWNVGFDGYMATCKECGKTIHLCSECLDAEDNEYQKCDWHKEKCPWDKTIEMSVCFRGRCYYEV